jgi:hypothetical protein
MHIMANMINMISESVFFFLNCNIYTVSIQINSLTRPQTRNHIYHIYIFPVWGHVRHDMHIRCPFLLQSLIAVYN